MRIILTFWVFFLLASVASAQMVVGSDTLYGNEWIQYDQNYYKIPVAEDGLVRFSGSDLVAVGIPINAINANQFQVFHLGKEVPIYVSTTGTLSNSDYITFAGQKNRTALDEFLFPEAGIRLHPNYSLFTDTSAYFLTWSPNVQGLRYNVIGNDITNHPAATPYFLRKLEKNFQNYWAKKEYGSGTKFSHFDVAEGFSTSLKTNQTHTFNPSSPDLSGPNAILEVYYASRGDDHHQEIRINNSLVKTDEYSGWKVRHLSFEVAAAALSSSVSFKMKGLANAQNKLDRSRIGLLQLTYPQQFDFEGQGQFVFELESKAHYLEIMNVDLAQGTPILYDVANQQRLEGIIENDLVVFMLPQTNNPKKLVLSAGDNSIIEASLTPITFIDYASANSDYLMITNARLLDDGNGHNYVQDYADYRASIAGGSYNPLIVDVQQVYDQFGYGVQRNPIGIRNMVQWAVRKWADSRFVYLIGKGRTYNKIRRAEDLLAAQATMLVPTFGSPGGDNQFATAIFDFSPRIAMGRLAVTTPEEVLLYFNKIKSLEQNQKSLGQMIENQSWKKKVIHLGGGNTAYEKNTIKSHLNAMGQIIGKSDLASKNISFFKDLNDPIQKSVPEQIFSAINDGVALLTIFGHSSPGSFDFNIDNPEYYDNAGRFPVLTSLGCYSGDIFTSQKGISERFCLYDNKGAIGFVAATSLGYISTLSTFGKLYYEKLGKQTTIGEGLQQVFEQYKTLGLTSDMHRLTEQMLLNGDPAIQIGVSKGVDYVIDYESVNFGEATISTRKDSISATLSIFNIGKNYTDSVSLKFKHLLPNGQVFVEENRTIFPKGYETPVTLKWLNPGTSGLGQNTLRVEVDYLQNIDELPQPEAELNNNLVSQTGVVGIPFFISDNSTTPIEPRPFAIKNKSNITLIASTSNAFAKETKYLIQLDTTELFNSNLLEETAITQIGGLIKWKPNTIWLDTTVYYWRISPDSISSDLGYLWSGSSFITTTDTIEGWNQSHFYQFKKDKFKDLVIERDKDLAFSENGFFLSLKNKVKNINGSSQFIYNLENVAASVKPWNFLNSGMAVFVGDKYTGSGWKNVPGGLYGSVNPGTTRVFAFPTNTESEREKLMSFLKDVIPDGSYVWVFSVLKDSTQNYMPEEWGLDSINLGYNIFSILEGEGATKIRGLELLGAVPYTIMYQKGQGVWKEDIGESKNSILFTEVFIPVKNMKGSIETNLIGPASQWLSLEWDKHVELNDMDTLSLYGVSYSKLDTTLLYESIEDYSIPLLSIDAQEYPFLILKYRVRDDEFRSAPDLDFWKVHYSPLPEMAVNPSAFYEFYADTINYGDELTVKVAIENISSLPMDSILIALKISNELNQTYSISKRWAPLTAFDVDTIQYSIPTKDLYLGRLSLSLEANPNTDQPEIFHGNNFGLISFYVKSDTEKPVLDVFFDGVRILEGDIVSAKPKIEIVLDDENNFLNLIDTALFRISLVLPNQSIQRVYFTDPNLTFEPAQTQKNTAKVTYEPILSNDGLYKLLVEAKDASGNSAGNVVFEIGFNIIQKRMISNVLPYPNPFSTATRFAYTLTGDAAPEVFTIQILAVDGKIVREITQDEIGPLRVGKHLSDYQWDGRDEYGDLLANGVYLYRLIVKDGESEKLEVYRTSADSFFDKSFGKIVILR